MSKIKRKEKEITEYSWGKSVGDVDVINECWKENHMQNVNNLLFESYT